jgi:3-deoxy-manno-octulosonate cytidylyltransferase (CMP-KDO synthetase)
VRRVAVIIPARFGATRLPGKPLADVRGKPLLAHVVERARAARGAGAEVALTGPAETGTDRAAMAARAMLPRPTMERPLVDGEWERPEVVKVVTDRGGNALSCSRALEHGFRIRVVDTSYSGFGVDTEQDLERARALVAAGRQVGKG